MRREVVYRVMKEHEFVQEHDGKMQLGLTLKQIYDLMMEYADRGEVRRYSRSFVTYTVCEMINDDAVERIPQSGARANSKPKLYRTLPADMEKLRESRPGGWVSNKRNATQTGYNAKQRKMVYGAASGRVTTVSKSHNGQRNAIAAAKRKAKKFSEADGPSAAPPSFGRRTPAGDTDEGRDHS